MRVFAKPTSLERLSLEARIVYTSFALFLLIGYATSAWLYLDDDFGVSGKNAETYYLGEAAAPLSETPGNIELPSDLPATPMRFQKPPRQVMETFHFHMFSVPVCLLIVAHLFMMSAFSTRTKAAIIGVSTVATLFHVLLPPLIRFVSPGFAPLFFPSALLMAVSWTFMTVEPVIEMWRPVRVAPGRSSVA
jgi:hypothetical protein